MMLKAAMLSARRGSIPIGSRPPQVCAQGTPQQHSGLHLCIAAPRAFAKHVMLTVSLLCRAAGTAGLGTGMARTKAWSRAWGRGRRGTECAATSRRKPPSLVANRLTRPRALEPAKGVAPRLPPRVTPHTHGGGASGILRPPQCPPATHAPPERRRGCGP